MCRQASLGAKPAARGGRGLWKHHEHSWKLQDHVCQLQNLSRQFQPESGHFQSPGNFRKKHQTTEHDNKTSNIITIIIKMKSVENASMSLDMHTLIPPPFSSPYKPSQTQNPTGQLKIVTFRKVAKIKGIRWGRRPGAETISSFIRISHCSSRLRHSTTIVVCIWSCYRTCSLIAVGLIRLTVTYLRCKQLACDAGQKSMNHFRCDNRS